MDSTPERTGHRRVSALSVVLLTAALSLVGAICVPKLNVQYTPSVTKHSLSIYYMMPGASAEVVEAEATAMIEGVVSSLDNVSDVSSVSRKNSGYVRVNFRKGTDMDVARFDVASAIRNIWPSLPEELSYPEISFSSSNQGKTAISYILKGSIPSQQIERYIQEHMINSLAGITDVDGVTISGATPWNWVITFDALKMKSVGISAEDIYEAFSDYNRSVILGRASSSDGQMTVNLITSSRMDFGEIPIRKVDGNVLYLRDLATWNYEEGEPDYYYRVNGLNTVTLSITITEYANLLKTVGGIKKIMSEIQASLPEEISCSLAYDSSSFVREELSKIFFRTGLCILILLLLVTIVSRTWQYLCVITFALTANVLIALGVYALIGIQVHIYTLAGITVSLGLIIDTSIIMADHFGLWKNKRVFPALFTATATTIASVVLLFLLPESERTNLNEFFLVIIINLSISIAIAYLFIPSMMELLSTESGGISRIVKHKRRFVRLNMIYGRIVAWGVCHRWIFILFFLALFAYSFHAFYKSLDKSDFYRTPEQKLLYIQASMPEGCTVGQLNEVVKVMENYLAGFDEISVFTTSIYSATNANIVVEFKPEYMNTFFPSHLKMLVTEMAINYGGANWSISGIDNNAFDNNIVTDYRSNRIQLNGYNYEDLIRYARILEEKLSVNPRVQDLEIWGNGWWGRPETEFNVEYDREKIEIKGISPYKYFRGLSLQLYNRQIGSVIMNGWPTDVMLRSSNQYDYDLWHVLHSPVAADSLEIPFNRVGSIIKQRTGMEIHKSNQSYEVSVCFNYIGEPLSCERMIQNSVDYMNKEVLPLGFIAKTNKSGWFKEHKERFAWLILLIIFTIFIILAISFESIKLPVSVICMIPVSFIGVFLIFGLTKLSFDQGGFASMVLLCGIVVNAGIYLISSWRARNGSRHIRLNRRVNSYIRALNYKALPLLLTIVSTALGLIPFLSEGPDEPFWFDFAVGTIAGLFFSVVAILVLPILIIPKRIKTT